MWVLREELKMTGETLIEELANRAKVDPIAYRLRLLNKDANKFRAVLTLLDEKAGWRTKLPNGHAAHAPAVL